jgi:uncharacterized Zn finger protein
MDDYDYDFDFDDDDDDFFTDALSHMLMSHAEPEELVPEDAVILPAPIHAKSKRGGFGETWWGERWYDLLTYSSSSRINNGKSYARNGSVTFMAVAKGTVLAEVNGSSYRPYRTALLMDTFTDESWDAVLKTLSQQPLYLAQLLAGEMPDDLDLVFRKHKLDLFPEDIDDIHFECSCPDWGYPCKHSLAVFFLMAEQLDRNPLTLLHLRGRTREEVLAALQGKDVSEIVAASDTPEINNPPITLENIWHVPDLPPMLDTPKKPKEPECIRLHGYPPDVPQKPFREIYKVTAKAALRWLGE